MKRRKTPTLKKDHKASKIVLKTAEVDDGMAPLILWLNEFESVLTKACCQGEYAPVPKTLGGVIASWEGDFDPTKRPYVSFICMDGAELAVILSVLYLRASVEVEWSRENPYLRYRAEWPNRQRLDETIKYLRQTWGLS